MLLNRIEAQMIIQEHQLYKSSYWDSYATAISADLFHFKKK